MLVVPEHHYPLICVSVVKGSQPDQVVTFGTVDPNDIAPTFTEPGRNRSPNAIPFITTFVSVAWYYVYLIQHQNRYKMFSALRQTKSRIGTSQGEAALDRSVCCWFGTRRVRMTGWSECVEMVWVFVLVFCFRHIPNVCDSRHATGKRHHTGVFGPWVRIYRLIHVIMT